MCFDQDSRPPIAPIAGGATDARDLTLRRRTARTSSPTRRARRARPAPAWWCSRTCAASTSTTRSWRCASPRTASTPSRSTSSAAPTRPTIGATLRLDAARRADEGGDPPGRRRGDGGVPALEGAAAVRALFSVGFCFGGALSFNQAASGLGYAGVIGFYGWPLGLPRWPDRPKPIDAVVAVPEPGAGDLRRGGPGHPAERDPAVRPGAGRGGRPARDVHLRRRAAQLLRPEADQFAADSADAWRRVQDFVTRHTPAA